MACSITAATTTFSRSARQTVICQTVLTGQPAVKGAISTSGACFASCRAGRSVLTGPTSCKKRATACSFIAFRHGRSTTTFSAIATSRAIRAGTGHFVVSAVNRMSCVFIPVSTLKRSHTSHHRHRLTYRKSRSCYKSSGISY